MKRLTRVSRLGTVSLLLMVVLAPVSWAADSADLPQQGDSGNGGADSHGDTSLALALHISRLDIPLITRKHPYGVL